MSNSKQDKNYPNPNKRRLTVRDIAGEVGMPYNQRLVKWQDHLYMA